MGGGSQPSDFTVTGDDGFAQYMVELNTAVKFNISIKHILLNNNELGKISKEQRTDGKTVWSTSLHNSDFYKYAQIVGALGVRVNEPSKIDQALDQIINHDGPAMLEIMTDPELM